MNDAIEEYLDYYTALEIDPNYAVLINGDWGAGKTWFIKKYLEENEQVKSLYITLYGVNSSHEIDEQFFQQLHPLLSSKGMMIAGKVFRGFAKGALKIDLGGDGNASGEMNLSIPDLNLPDFLKNTEDHILVFDDLERANINPDDLLGYINQFVEHNGQKVIIIANEVEIDSEKYQKIKEKVVGRTFSVTPSFDDAFNTFLSEIGNPSLRKKISNHHDLIKTIFDNSESNNLRYLRYGLTELDRLLREIQNSCKKCFKNEKIITDLLGFYFAIFIEINRGNLPTKHLKNLRIVMYGSMMGNNGNQEDPEVTKIIKRYPTVSFDDIVFTENFWYQFFEKGTIDKNEIDKLKESPTYFAKETPLWRKLWSYFDLTDEAFTKAIEEAEDKFRNDKFSDFGELAHITGSLMQLNNDGIYNNKSKKQLLSESVEQIDTLIAQNKIQIELKVHYHSFTRDYNMGHGYQGSELEEFKNFLKYFRNKYKGEVDKIVQDKADQILDDLPSNPKDFISTISNGTNSYHLFSIITHLDKNKFLKQLEKLTPKNRRDVLLSLKSRISDRSASSEEKVRIKEIKKDLETKYQKNKDSIENHVVNKILDGFESEFTS